MLAACVENPLCMRRGAGALRCYPRLVARRRQSSQLALSGRTPSRNYLLDPFAKFVVAQEQKGADGPRVAFGFVSQSANSKQPRQRSSKHF